MRGANLPSHRLWAVVLAAGEGRRLRSLTRALHGADRPKQFAEIEPGRSLLRSTLERIAPLVPACRTLVVVDRRQEDLARAEMRRFPEAELVLQPTNLDTGPGILLPLARITARDPEARVAIFPSDHYVPEPAPFLAGIRLAVRASRALPRSITLLGIAPDDAEGEYGWIVPDAGLGATDLPGVLGVRRFVEKPDPATASRLLEEGALWNSFVLVGSVAAFWSVAEEHIAEHASLFHSHTGQVGAPDEERRLFDLYDGMRPVNFSRAVLTRTARLAVVPVSGSGWTDWGSPERVIRSLRESGKLESLLERIGSSRVPIFDETMTACPARDA